MAERYQVFWQPGCSSCLRTKEFLKANGVPFDSINIRADEESLAMLVRLGAKSVPVVSLGDKFVFAQDLSTVAGFVGIAPPERGLPPEALATKLDAVLAAAGRYVLQLPDDVLANGLPGRDRNFLDLAFHIFVIPLAFLEAARGGELTFEFFERKPPAGMTSASQVAAFGEEVRQEFETWWRANRADLVPRVATYYGEQTTASVLERTAWHAAQHCRQLMAVLEQLDIPPDGALGSAELDGLPLPEEIYDDEIAMNAD